MNARVGDRLVVLSPTLDRPDRDGEILEVHGQNSQPPSVVRWSDSGRVGLYFPGADAHIRVATEEAV